MTAFDSQEERVGAVRNDPILPGEVIGEKYVVERVIGVGGLAIVVAARHRELDEVVAIKLLRRDMQVRPEVVRRFGREARAAVRIKSEHAARIFDVGLEDGRGPYLVMEYLEGQDLGQRLEASGPLPVRSAAEYLIQACEGLAVAHAAGIVHRDIKPDNLFLARRPDGGEVLKVLDFGISKLVLTGSPSQAVAAALQTQQLMGTPLYMSPEQIRNEGDLDHRSDVWSLGAALHELLTGRFAFPGESITEICARVLEARAEPLRGVRPELEFPPLLQLVVDRCLAKDREHRFRNVAELADALLPFAPSRCHDLVQRANATLVAAGHPPIRVTSGSVPPPLHETLVSIDQPLPRPAPLPAADSTGPAARSAPPVGAGGASIAPDAAPAEGRLPRGFAVGLGLGAVAVLGALALFGATTQPRSSSAASTTSPATPSERRPVALVTDPSGARITWDGRLLGETPLRTRLPEGVHTVVVERSGYAAEELTVTVTAEDSEVQTIRLTLAAEAPAPPAATSAAADAKPSDEGRRPPSRPQRPRSILASAEPSPGSASPEGPAPPAPAVPPTTPPETGIKVIGEGADVKVIE